MLSVDGVSNYTELANHTNFLYMSPADVTVGAIPLSESLPAPTDNFRGCIRDLNIDQR